MTANAGAVTSAKPDFSDLPESIARHRVLSTSRAAEFVGRHEVVWRRMCRAGETPAPVKLGKRSLGWRVGDLVDWLATKIQKEAA
jgi:predicted DNA-binding transcriptional regulator AlpA